MIPDVKGSSISISMRKVVKVEVEGRCAKINKFGVQFSFLFCLFYFLSLSAPTGA